MKKIYTDEQIVGFVREAEKTEATIAEFCRQKGFNARHILQVEKAFRLDAGRRSQKAS